MIKKYNTETEDFMVIFFENLREKDQRHYAAVEAKKLGHGGIVYISELFGIAEKTISRGIDEIEKKTCKARTSSKFWSWEKTERNMLP
jgi:hypothetical protein